MFQSCAFTLLDVLLAMAIFAILAAIAIPNWASQLPTYRLNSAARQVQSELHRVKSQAVAGSAGFRLVFLAPAAYRIERDDGAAYQSTGEQRILPVGVTFGGGSISIISFTPRGTSNGGTIKLCNDKHEGKNIVVLSSTGRVRVTSGAC